MLIVLSFRFILIDVVLFRFGYVEFATAESASKAMEFEGKRIDGRPIHVDFASSSNKKSNFQGDVSDTIFIGNLSFEATEDEIWKTFGNYGTIVSVRLPTHEDTGSLKG